MIFQDNVIKEYLKNVYFITGTPCGGKTTVSRVLAEKYGFELFDVDERFDEHKKMSNPLFQPAMNTYFNSADEFFGRAKPEYIIVKGECLEKLKQQGYEMDCWQKGIPLAINNKHPDSIKLKGF